MKRINRVQRFLVIRDAVMSRFPDMHQTQRGVHELVCGPFLVHFTLPGANGMGRGFNLQIWPSGTVDAGHILHGNKVANVDWFGDGRVEIISFRSGSWEQELLSFLSDEGNILAFSPVKRKRHLAPIL